MYTHLESNIGMNKLVHADECGQIKEQKTNKKKMLF